MSSEFYKKAIESFNGEDCSAKEASLRVEELYPNFIKEKKGGVKQVSAEIGSMFITKMVFEDQGYIANRNSKPMSVFFDPSFLTDTDTDTTIAYNREEITEKALSKLSKTNIARMKGFEIINKRMKIAGFDCEVDHVKSLKNEGENAHHPDNLVIMLKHHNRRKSKKSFKRWTWEKQKDYILSQVELELSMGFDIDKDAIIVYLGMLEVIY